MLMYTILLVATWIIAINAVNPILFFPGYALSKLAVTVSNGSVQGCPTNGSFVVEFLMKDEQNGFSQECMMNYLSLTYNQSNTAHPFSNRPDVSITSPGRTTGSVDCLQYSSYNDMVDYFTARGYTTNSPNATFLAACYDWRMDPSHDAIDGPSFMDNAINLTLQAYAASGNQKVWVIGHSNGPIMALYFLTHVTPAFRQQYIAGFIPLSGNFGGQGLLPMVFLQGMSVIDFSFFPPSLEVHRGWPANYISSPQPAVFSGPNAVYILQTNTPDKKFYVTSSDYDSFFQLSNNTFGLSNWRDFVGIVGPHTPPNVYTFAVWGNNISTLYGLHVDSFNNFTIIDQFFRNGDYNQEDIDNESCFVWNSTMPRGCFDFFVRDNVDHFELSEDLQVLNRIYAIISNPPNVTCETIPSTTSTATSTSNSTSSTSSTSSSTSSTSSTSTTSSSVLSATPHLVHWLVLLLVLLFAC